MKIEMPRRVIDPAGHFVINLFSVRYASGGMKKMHSRQ